MQVHSWKQARRWFSMQAMGAALALQTGLLAVPDDLKVHIPQKVTQAVTLALLALGIVGRMLKQGETK